MTMMRLKSAAPTFAVADVGTTMRWYEEHLGFRGYPFPQAEPFALASLLRDDVEVMLLRIDGYERPDIASRRPEGYWDAYMRMRGVHAFYEKVRPKRDDKDAAHKTRLRRLGSLGLSTPTDTSSSSANC